MPEPVLHPTTRQQIASFLARPAHALILFGPEGSGKSRLARYIAAQVLALPSEAALDNYPYVRIVASEGSSISIDAVRDLLQFVKLKVATAREGIRRIAIIEQSHLLTTEAQNALLKLLEEPPADTILILTAANDQALLPTIRSRAQTINMQPPPKEDLEVHFIAQAFTPAKIRQAYLMSGGLPGLMTALLEEDDNHPLVLAATQARELLRTDAFTRLALVDALSKQRLDSSRLLFMLAQMSHAAMEQAASKEPPDNQRSIARWQRILHAAYDADAALQASAQPKLVLTNLMLHL